MPLITIQVCEALKGGAEEKRVGDFQFHSEVMLPQPGQVMMFNNKVWRVIGYRWDAEHGKAAVLTMHVTKPEAPMIVPATAMPGPGLIGPNKAN